MFVFVFNYNKAFFYAAISLATLKSIDVKNIPFSIHTSTTKPLF